MKNFTLGALLGTSLFWVVFRRFQFLVMIAIQDGKCHVNVEN